MNLEEITTACNTVVEETITNYKANFPFDERHVEKWHNDTLNAIKGYADKVKFLGLEFTINELKGYKKTAEEILNEAINEYYTNREEGDEENVLIGMLENNWIKTFLSYIETKEKPNQKQPTNREVMIAHGFKVNAGLANIMQPQDWGKERGSNAKNLAYSLIPTKKKGYKAPTEKELKKVVEILADSPIAQHLAIKQLQATQSL